MANLKETTVDGNLIVGTQVNKATISYTANTERTYTIPDVTTSSFVMTAGDQDVGGVKTFSSTISGSISGNAGTVTNGVYTTSDQTIAGVKTFSDNVVLSGSGAIKLPVGSDGQRPSPATGMLRFNTNSVSFEGYDGAVWGAIGGGADSVDNILASQVFG